MKNDRDYQNNRIKRLEYKVQALENKLSFDSEHGLSKVRVWTRRQIKDTVWVIATADELNTETYYKTNGASDNTFEYIYVHDKWQPDSLYRYLVTEIEECNLPAEL